MWGLVPPSLAGGHSKPKSKNQIRTERLKKALRSSWLPESCIQPKKFEDLQLCNYPAMLLSYCGAEIKPLTGKKGRARPFQQLWQMRQLQLM